MSSKFQKALIFLFRYLIPGLATVTGIAAWIFAGLLQNTDNAWAIYKPTQETGRPITQEQAIPELPYDEINNGSVPSTGEVWCTKKSFASSAGIQCEDSMHRVLDPCYVMAGDTVPTDAFCFDPVGYKYIGYSISEWGEGLSMGSPDGTATFILVRAPEENNVNDYSPKLVEIGGFYYDVCTLKNNSKTEKSKGDYLCVTGSKLSGGIMGDRPFYFTRYTDKRSGQTTSQWIGWILYG